MNIQKNIFKLFILTKIYKAIKIYSMWKFPKEVPEKQNKRINKQINKEIKK